MHKSARSTAILLLCLLAGSWQPAHAQSATTWYLAEGATGMFEEEILIANPNALPALVEIQYLLPNGVAGPNKQITVPATSRATVRVNDDVPTGSVSAVVTSSIPIVVERSMYWGGAARKGGHNATGVTAPAVEWYLAEGVSSNFFDEFILIANPNNADTTVEVTYLGRDGVRDVETRTVVANSRESIVVKAKGGKFLARDFSAKVKSLNPALPIIVERAIYWGGIFKPGTNPGGTSATGVTETSTTWRFAEGFTQGFKDGAFRTFLLYANPSETEDANVRTTFLFEDGTTQEDVRTVKRNSRENIEVRDLPGPAANRAFSILVESTNGVGIVAERAMYWGGFREGHVVAGMTQEATTWAFAEGIEDIHGGIDYDTYFLLANSSSSPATVTGTFYRDDGTGFTKTFTINPTSRYTFIAAQYPQLSNRKFAAFFQSDIPIVAERAVYWGAGYYGGHASAGVPWTGAIATPPPPGTPTVTSITPASGSIGADVTIRGTNFGKKVGVTFGGVDSPLVKVHDAQTVIARAPTNNAGAKQVVLSTLGQQAVSPTDYTYNNPGGAVGPPVAIYCDQFASNGVCLRTVTPRFPVNYYGVIDQLARDRRDLLINSCVEHGGNNRFMFEAVRRLRAATGSNRWGLNIKRGSQGLSQDIVTYYYGPEGTTMEGDIRVYIFDIIGSHCGSPGPNWADVTEDTRRGGTIGRWTTAGQTF